MAVDWSDYDVYEPLIKKYLPDRGEGESKGEQLVTAVNKLIYKWYNDGDVFDNTGYMTGWANDLSSYANWIYSNIPASRRILDRVFDCANDDEYEDLLWDLSEITLDDKYLDDLSKEPKEGSIYDCDGPYQFVENDEDEDEDDYYEEEEEEEDWDEDIESSVDINAADDADVDVLEDAMKDLKDDFDFLVAGLEKLQRSGGEDYNTAVEIARSFSDRIQETIAEISERFGESNI